ncbi:M43 family zinc metalloprotease [Belliella kenyensis]|uniref:M43 family zinc metalloprotease n=1 Tax=Belliella kenyensis TaxID=1472724 RepID=A0ABV8EI91_9BACT|nr:M43 family zinc metalloprotease [Belliella kenyensis]MCH7401878.1 M43 family zinc metalloprotease [Belliella kenyensis]MDN3604378.1 M43 family zinc metalloprotease [Belliella kenyensis]
MIRTSSQLRVNNCFTLFFFLLSFSIKAQSFFGQPLQHIHDEKCAHVYFEKLQEEALGVYGSRDYFESWISGKLEEVAKSPRIQSRMQNDPRVIPVVVHVIHGGTPIGQGSNIPVSQIESQIRILNEDFRRENLDRNQTPSEFLNVAADANIEFVLAKVDPRGLPTNGIVRVLGTKNLYDQTDAALISELSIWPPESYLNIWVVPLQQPFIGYATFPVSDLPGLNFIPTQRELDGITVDYRYFGQGGNAISGSRGRTATHEVGHFFGLRHIWGDAQNPANGCDVDDFVEDTPNQQNANNSCRINIPIFSCGSRDMTENFMDYSPDACMNLFTQGQVNRMNAVLEFSPRRNSLINNFATQDPNLFGLDLSIERIIDPQDLICESTIVPSLEILNRGTTTITSAVIEIRLNGALLQSRNFSFNLAIGEVALVEFNPITLTGNGQDQFQAIITQVNGQDSDDNTSNNVISSLPVLQTALTLPYALNLSSDTNNWIIRNPDNSFTWEKISLPISGTNQDLMRIQNFLYEATGALDFFISPSINLNNFPNAQLTFNMAHAPYNSAGISDAMFIAVSTDCGNTFNILDAPYSKESFQLQTANPTLNEFIPSSNAQFRREIVNLEAYNDFDNVRIAFIARNGYGNNIYLKDIEVLTEETYSYKLDLIKLISPGPINNGTQSEEVLQVFNSGNLSINSFTLNRQTNNSTVQSFVGTGFNIGPNQSFDLELDNSLNSNGTSRISYEITSPNFDQNPGNESSLIQFNVRNTNTITVPWRQNFNNSTALEPWTSVNINSNQNSWEVIPLQSETQNNLIRLRNDNANEEHWLGSPTFDLSGSRQASVFYRIAASNQSPSTIFKIMGSIDGGVNYTELDRKSGEEINTLTSGIVNPNMREHFSRGFVDLSSLTGSGRTNARIAFVAENGSTTNDPIYIDDIELFLSANPDPVDPGLGNTVIYPNPARDVFNVTFNLRTNEEVNIQVISSTGAMVQDINYPNTLNQTYTFSTSLFSKGVFIVKITSNSITETRKLIIH